MKAVFHFPSRSKAFENEPIKHDAGIKLLRLWRSLLIKRNKEVAMDDAASPLSTAHISADENFSMACNPHCLTPCSDSTSIRALHGNDVRRSATFDDDMSSSTTISAVRVLFTWRELLRRSLKRLFKRRRREIKSNLSYQQEASSLSSTDQDIHSAIFSISTDRKRTISNIECYVEPSTSNTSESRVSLHDFIEREKSKSHPKSIHLGNISAQDSISVESAFLAVSFDDDYPQLVMQTSLTEEKTPPLKNGSRRNSYMNSAWNDDDGSVCCFPIPREHTVSTCLGVSFPHPARRPASHTSVSSGKKAPPSTPHWFDEKAFRMWGSIDGSSSDLGDPILDPVMNHDDATIERPSPNHIETRYADWDEDGNDMRWSFSNDESVVSFSSVMGGNSPQLIIHRIGAMPMSNDPCDSSTDRPYDET